MKSFSGTSGNVQSNQGQQLIKPGATKTVTATTVSLQTVTSTDSQKGQSLLVSAIEKALREPIPQKAVQPGGLRNLLLK